MTKRKSSRPRKKIKLTAELVLDDGEFVLDKEKPPKKKRKRKRKQSKYVTVYEQEEGEPPKKKRKRRRKDTSDKKKAPKKKRKKRKTKAKPKKRKKRWKRKADVPGYKETDNFYIATRQGKLVKWLKMEGYDVEGRFEHYLKKDKRYIKKAIKLGYTVGCPHVFINTPKGSYDKCAIYLFNNSSENQKIGIFLIENDVKVFHFKKESGLEYIKNILMNRYLNLNEVIFIE